MTTNKNELQKYDLNGKNNDTPKMDKYINNSSLLNFVYTLSNLI